MVPQRPRGTSTTAALKQFVSFLYKSGRRGMFCPLVSRPNQPGIHLSSQIDGAIAVVAAMFTIMFFQRHQQGVVEI